MASVSAMALQLQRLSNQATRESFQYNTKEANTARTWQKMMSDTSHQREVEDLKKAGLNPILSSGGAGAQSYTTSSASAAAENAANAVGGLYQSKISADATRAAAAQSAAAMRAAAATQAAAARFSAQKQYEASLFHSQKAYDANVKTAQINAKNRIDVAKLQPVKTVPGFIDKALNNLGIWQGVSSGLGKAVQNGISAVGKNPLKAFVDTGKTITQSNFKLNSSGNSMFGSYLNRLGVKNTQANRNLAVKAFFFGNSSALSTLARQSYKRIPKSRNASVSKNPYTARFSL